MALVGKIIPIFLIIWGLQRQESQIEASSGFDAMFTQENADFRGTKTAKTVSHSNRLKRDVDEACVIDDIDEKFKLHQHHVSVHFSNK